MAYTPPVEVDRQKLTIMGVDFSAVNDFEAAVSSLGSAMFEGFDPNPKKMEILRDYLTKKISFVELAELTKNRTYAR